MSTEADGPALAERMALKMFVEACLVLEEGVAGARDIDLGMMAGAGIVPPPLARADAAGLDEVLAALERAEAEWGEAFAPPLILRRLVAQGRLGRSAGQGFFPYPRPDAGFDDGPVLLETRDEVAIAWLASPPANALSPETIAALSAAWERVDRDPGIRALIVASANPVLFCAGADIKSFTGMDEASGRELLDRAHGLFRAFGSTRTATVAAVNGLAFGGGCELAMACDIRLAAESASFGQPEIALGIVPGFGGTQRLPRLVGPAKALEMNLVGDPISAGEALEHGLVHRVIPDHELHDAAVAWARTLAARAPVAVEQIKRASHRGDLDEGIAAEKAAFAAAFATADAREGFAAFLAKRPPRWTGA
ncbi:MAG: enoyl-CoA hydratase-related protein [Solirubrobacteraceae bacterium]